MECCFCCIGQSTYAASHSQLESIHEKWKVALGVNMEHTMDSRQLSALKQLSSSVSHFLRKVSYSFGSEEIVSVSLVSQNSPNCLLLILQPQSGGWCLWSKYEIRVLGIGCVHGQNMKSKCRDRLCSVTIICIAYYLRTEAMWDHCFRSSLLVLAKPIKHCYAQSIQECVHCKYFPFNPHNNLISNRCTSLAPPVHIVAPFFNQNAFEPVSPVHAYC